MSVNIIAAIGKNNELGKDNNLIWRLPKDLKFFKETTMGNYIVMGRKTFESLPKKLPGRISVVISRNNLEIDNDIICYHNLEEALNELSNKDIFIIGGASIYEQTLPYADILYLTHVEASDKEADAYFPIFDEQEWNIENLEEGIDNGMEYQRKKYVRKKVK